MLTDFIVHSTKVALQQSSYLQLQQLNVIVKHFNLDFAVP